MTHEKYQTEAERKAYQDGYIAGQALPESGAGAMIKIMRRLGIIGASYGEIANHVCTRLDGCEQVIDSLKRQEWRNRKNNK